MKTLPFALLCSLLLAQSAIAAFLTDLNNSQTAFNAYFSMQGNGDFATSWQMTGGVGNSSYIRTTSQENAALLRESSGSFAEQANVMRISSYVQARPPAHDVRIGFDTSPSGALNGGQYIAAGLTDAGSGQTQLALVFRENLTLQLKSSTLLSLIDYDWYQLEAVFTKDPALIGRFNVALKLYHWGTDGVTGGTLLDTHTLSVDGLNTVWQANDIYAGFRGRSIGGSGGARGFDNFFATTRPDPAKDATVIQYPDSVTYDVTDFGAIPNDFLDDTAAIQAAIDANQTAFNTPNRTHRTRIVYLPAGIYRISDTLVFPANAISIRLQGEAEALTTIQLAPVDNSFDQPTTAKAMIYTGDYSLGASRFHLAIRNLTLDAGHHTGAIGLNFYTNNRGGVRNVTIIGKGHIGLDLGHSDANGPSLIQNVTINGFETGIWAKAPWQSTVFEDITLRNQSVIGFYNEKHVVSIRGLIAEQLAVPALQNIEGFAVVTESQLAGTNASVAAIINDSTSRMLVHETTFSGYGTSIDDPENPLLSGNVVGDWTSDPMPESGGTGMPTWVVPPTPTVAWDAPSEWANIIDYGATDSDGDTSSPYYFDGDDVPVQAAMNSGKSTVLIPSGHFRPRDQVGGVTAPPVTVPASVQRVAFVGIYGIPTFLATEADPSVGFEINEPAIGSPTMGTPIVFEDVSVGFPDEKKTVSIYHNANRPLVIRSSAVPVLKVADGAGPVFLESMTGRKLLLGEAKVWAKQLNPESDSRITTTKISMSGTQLWTLGLKTEGSGHVLEARDQSQVAIFGGMVYTLSDASAHSMLVYEQGSSLDVSLNEFLRDFGSTVRYDRLITEVTTSDLEAVSLYSGDDLTSSPYWPAPHSAETYFGDPTAPVGSSLALFSAPIASTGTLVGASTYQNRDTYQLTTASIIDWSYFGYTSSPVQTRKTGADTIGNVQTIGTGSLLTRSYTGSNNYPWDAFSFSDGDSPVALTNKTNCFDITGVNGVGLSIDVPADQQMRRVTIWASGWESEAEFTATLSDGSAPAYSVIVSPHNIPGNFHMHKHSIEYAAGRNGETLTLKIVKTLSTPGAIAKGQEGNVKFNAIMLEEL